MGGHLRAAPRRASRRSTRRRRRARHGPHAGDRARGGQRPKEPAPKPSPRRSMEAAKDRGLSSARAASTATCCASRPRSNVTREDADQAADILDQALAEGGQGVSLSRRPGKRTRRLVSFLRRRAAADPARRPEMDCRSFPDLFRKSAVVFTDTADFTVRTARDGILHFLMIFERFVGEAEKVVARADGDVVKVEADSLLLRFDDVETACRGRGGAGGAAAAHEPPLPANERLRLQLRDRLRRRPGPRRRRLRPRGEPRRARSARTWPGPARPCSPPRRPPRLDAATLRRVVPHQVVTFGTERHPRSTG